MIGSFRWNVVAGVIGLIGTFMISVSQNVMKTALVQSLYSFLFLFFFTFAVRWVLGILVSASEANADGPPVREEAADSFRGRNIDYSTPEDGAAPPEDNPEQGDQDGFAPLNPPKLTTKMDQQPDELAKALRRMTEE